MSKKTPTVKLDLVSLKPVESNFSFHMAESNINHILVTEEGNSPHPVGESAILLQAVFLKHVKEFCLMKQVNVALTLGAAFLNSK